MRPGRAGQDRTGTTRTRAITGTAVLSAVGATALTAAMLLGAGAAHGTTAPTPTPIFIDYGKSTSLSTTITDSHGGNIADASVTLLSRTSSGQSFTPVTTTQTNLSGRASATVAPRVNTQYEWHFAGDGTNPASTSPVQQVLVSIVVVARLKAHAVAPHVTMWGGAAPQLPGSYVYLQIETSKGGWANVTRAQMLKQKLPNGLTEVGFIMPFTLHNGGTYRVYHPATAANAAGASVPNTITVKK